MKKNLPNILCVVVLLTLILSSLYATYTFGIGSFLRVCGILFLAAGVTVFIFFLSIDPGYRWVKSIDLTSNYRIIFFSISIGMTGFVLMMTGGHLHELRLKSTAETNRCERILSGGVESVMQEEWYDILDRQNRSGLLVYLMQQKKNRYNFRIIAVPERPGKQIVSDLYLSSAPAGLINKHIKPSDSACTGAIESAISMDILENQKVRKKEFIDIRVKTSTGKKPGATHELAETAFRLQIKGDTE